MTFSSFGLLHLLTVAILALAIATACVVGRRLHGAARRRYELGLAAASAALWIGYQVWDTAHNGWDPGHSLPLQLCDFTALISVLEFGRPSRRVHALAWFWGVALSSQALLTPDLSSGPTTIGFWAFWLYHFFIVGAGVYAVAARGFRPTCSDLRFAIGLGVVYAVAVLAVDAAFDLNYGYLGRATPSRPTLLDVLGPWPLRAMSMTVLAALAMTLFQLPWAVLRRGVPQADSVPRGGKAGMA